jgi:8-oxo-dGTP pyrophosphatase MutT (NUDIX family)
MANNRIRPLAICIFSRAGSILVAAGIDPVKGNQEFYRPLGGGIEFGEHSQQTLVRELREEIGAEVANLRYLGALENIFVFNGDPGHEIVLVYDGEFVDRSLYAREWINGSEGEENDLKFRAVWLPLDGFRTGTPPLYPDGLYALLAT